MHVVDTKTHTVTKTLKITGEMARPMGVTASPDGRRVYVTTGRGQMLLAIDTAKDEVVGSVKVGTRLAVVRGANEHLPLLPHSGELGGGHVDDHPATPDDDEVLRCEGHLAHKVR